jgi:thioesterase domain-containing protein
VGIAGELYIGGAGVARGYLNRPELTAERFVEDPFAAEPGARMYKTGDLGRWLPDGNIEFLGRNDFQVKVRGFRIELGEIESILQQHPGIAQCAVISQTDDRADRRLVAYFVPADPHAAPAIEDLRETLNRRLPVYMLPAVFAAIEVMPLTPNGKIDRKALSLFKNDSSAFARSRQAIDPRTPTESAVKQLWERILGVGAVGVHDNFFESGGHSLLAMRLSNAIGKHFNVNVPLRDLFFAPTIEAQARLIAASSEKRPHELIVPVQLGDNSRPPFFMIHGYHLYPLLPQRLGIDQTFYGVQEYAPGEWVGDWTLESMMARYVQEIRSVQPRGPYFIAGFCSSALPAFEVARQLEQANETIGRLVIIDSAGRIPVSQAEQAGLQGVRFRAQLKSRKLKLPPASELYPFLKGFVAEKLRHLWMKIEGPLYSQSVRLCLRRGIQIPPYLRQKMVGGIRIVTLEAIRSYSLKPYGADIDVMLTSEMEKQLSAGTFHPWEHTTSGKVKVTFLPGDHITAFTPPNIDVFARELRTILDAAIEEYRSTPDKREVNV